MVSKYGTVCHFEIKRLESCLLALLSTKYEQFLPGAIGLGHMVFDWTDSGYKKSPECQNSFWELVLSGRFEHSPNVRIERYLNNRQMSERYFTMLLRAII